MRSVFLLGASLFVTACTQPAVMVENKGSMFFGNKYASARDYGNIAPASGGSYYSSNEPEVISYGTSMSETAPLTSVSTRDLSAPSKEASGGAVSISTRKLWESKPASSSNTSSSGYIPPVQGKITSAFGMRSNGMGNDGITYSAPLGEPVYATADGTVAYVGDELKSYGHMVIIKHTNNMNSSYAHLGRSVVSKDTTVNQGQIIGYVGQSGGAAEPQLHFALRNGKDAVNPANYLSKQLASY